MTKSEQWAWVLLIALMVIDGVLETEHRRRQRAFNASTRTAIETLLERTTDLQRANLVRSLSEMSNEQLMQVYRKKKGDVDAIRATMPEHSRLKDAIAEMIHRDNIEFEEQGGCMGACDQ